MKLAKNEIRAEMVAITHGSRDGLPIVIRIAPLAAPIIPFTSLPASTFS